MTVRNTISSIENGSRHIMVVVAETGEVLLSTIWQNEIPTEYLDKNVIRKEWKNHYELRLFI